MTTLSIAVLFYEGPIARAYLAYLKRADIKVETIIQMVPKLGFLSKFLPQEFRQSWSSRRKNLLAHYWPRTLAEKYPILYRTMTAAIAENYGLDDTFFSEIRSTDGLEAYAEKVVTIEVSGIADPQLPKILQEYTPTVMVFTGGGLVPAKVLEVNGLRVLHVHPGHLPHVRGADGLLWSMLVFGKPGASCFIMKPGIDQGDIIEACDSSALTFELSSAEKPDNRTLYQMLFSYYDPVLRADLLTKVLKRYSLENRIEAQPQNLRQGDTYHFMEERIKDRALCKIFYPNA